MKKRQDKHACQPRTIQAPRDASAETPGASAASGAGRPSGVDIYLADGSGELTKVIDRRQDEASWAEEVVIAPERADEWKAHVIAECEERDWSWAESSELSAGGNSGSLTIRLVPGSNAPCIVVTWERQRGAALVGRAWEDGEPRPPRGTASSFLEDIDARIASRKTTTDRRRVLLAYHGLPWRGELVLQEGLRLGPASKFGDTLIGPQIIVVDLEVQGIGRSGVTAEVERLIRALRIFLALVLRINSRQSELKYEWVTEVDAQAQKLASSIKLVGYVEETNAPPAFSTTVSRSIERRAVSRPGLGPVGITTDMTEMWVPEDTEQLWARLVALSSDRRQQFLQAGNAFLVGQFLWPEQRTAFAAFVVMACEALKPSGRAFDKMNLYDVVASLLSRREAEALRKRDRLHPQGVRSALVHRGELEDRELSPRILHDSFGDPSFDEMLRHLTTVVRICFIEWLRKGGNYTPIRLSPTPNNTKPRQASRK
jgi:hypothetical protein